MARRRGEPREIDAGDLEPVELEPIELEPIEFRGPDDLGVEPVTPRRRRPTRLAWTAATAAALVAVGAVAVAGRHHHSDSAAPPAPPATAAPIGTAPDPVGELVQRLAPYWPGGQAIVMYGRLYVARARDAHPALVVPELRAVIEDQSGPSLLISTFPELLVATEPNIAQRVLSPRAVAIRAAEPDEWWILHDDGSIRDTVTGEVLRPPAGLRITAAVPHGFVALDVPHNRWVVWSGDPSMSTLMPARADLLAAQGSMLIFRSNCTIDQCAVEIVDLAHRTEIDAYVPAVPDFAILSPTGDRVALASTLGDVFLVNTADGGVIARSRSRSLPSLSNPVAWSTDGEHLVIVQQDSVEVRNATDGSVSDVITGTAGLDQVAGLP